MKKLILVLVLAFTANKIVSQSNSELFKKANELYQKEQYSSALKKYEQITKEKHSSELYHNIGNCYYKLNEIAPSIYNYEKALKLNSSNTKAQNNLALAKLMTIDKIDELPKGFIDSIISKLNFLSYDTWGKLSIIFSCLGCIFFILFYNFKKASKKRIYFLMFILNIILLGLSYIVANVQYNTQKRKFAIIFSKKINITGEPVNNSTKAFTLHEGTKVEIIEEIEKWYEIKISDGRSGWIPSSHLKEI